MKAIAFMEWGEKKYPTVIPAKAGIQEVWIPDRGPG